MNCQNLQPPLFEFSSPKLTPADIFCSVLYRRPNQLSCLHVSLWLVPLETSYTVDHYQNPKLLLNLIEEKTQFLHQYLHLYGLPSDMIPTVVSPRCKSVTGAVHCHCSDLSWWAMCVANLIHKLACLHFPNLCCQENTSNNENRMVELWIQVQVYFHYYYLLQKNHSYPHIAKANLSG